MPSAVDTNVLVRFLVDDGSGQVASARNVFAGGRVFIPLSVLLESEWVLRSNFGFSRTQICDAFELVLGINSVLFQEENVVADAVASCRLGMDFADALHLHSAADCSTFYTFDRKLIRKAERTFPALPVRQP